MTTDTIVGIIVAAWPILGAIGTGIEAIGTAVAKPALVAIGQRLEAIFIDGPKLLKGTPK